MSIKCFFGFHTWIDNPYKGCYDGVVIGYKCSECGATVPHWTDKAHKILKRKRAAK